MGVFQLKTVDSFNEHLLLLTTFRLADNYFWYTFRLASEINLFINQILLFSALCPYDDIKIFYRNDFLL
jgi:hypothetical protein